MIVYCPSCNQRLNIPGEIGSETIRCPVCSSEFNFDLRASGMDTDMNQNPHDKTGRDQCTQGATGIKIMWKKPKKAVLMVAATALLFLGVYGWHYSAKKRLQGLSSKWESVFSQITEIESTIVDSSGVPLSEISYDNLSQLAEVFESHKDSLEAIKEGISSGNGMSFWLPSLRGRIAISMEERISHETELVAQAQSAIEAVSGLQKRTADIIGRSSDSRSTAVRALNANSDINEYQACAANLVLCSQKLPQVIHDAKKSESINQLAGLAESLRIGMVHKMSAALGAEADLLKTRLSATRKAQNLLIQYKNKLEYSLQEGAGVALAIESMANNIQPAIENAFQATRPVREFLDKANRPLFGTSMTALSLACQADPSINATANVLESLCGGIESTRREISDLIRANQPLANALTSYNSSRSRASIQQVVKASQAAAAYYSSKTSLFNPVLSRISEAERKARALSDAASRIYNRIPQGTINSLAEAAGSLANSARLPFEQGNQAIENVARSLGSFSDYENSYISSLGLLAKEPPELSSVGITEEPESVAATPVEQESGFYAREVRNQEGGAPAGHSIVYSSNSRGTYDVWVMDSEGSNKQNLSVVSHDPANAYAEHPGKWSPDGTKIAFISNKSGIEGVWIMEADGRNDVKLTTSTLQEIDCSWSPDGTRIFLTRSTRTNLSGCSACPYYEIYAHVLQSGGEIRLTDNSYREMLPAISPDGTQIVYVKAESAGDCCNTTDLWLMNSDGTGQGYLHGDSGLYDVNPVWGKANDRILFAKMYIWPQYEIVTLNPDGTGLARLTNNSYYDCPIAFSSDNSKILFKSDRNGQSDLWIMDASGNILAQLTDDSADEEGGDWK